MKEVNINITAAGFPSQFVSDAEKATDEFGLQIGQAIQYEWFKKDSNNCKFYDQQRDFRRLRLYARGEQSIAKYKNELAVDGDLSYLNLDWTPVPILPKFVDIVVNGMSNRLFSVKAFAQDAAVCKRIGIKPIVIHGGGPQIKIKLKEQNIVQVQVAVILKERLRLEAVLQIYDLVNLVIFLLLHCV